MDFDCFSGLHAVISWSNELNKEVACMKTRENAAAENFGESILSNGAGAGVCQSNISEEENWRPIPMRGDALPTSLGSSLGPTEAVHTITNTLASCNYSGASVSQNSLNAFTVLLEKEVQHSQPYIEFDDIWGTDATQSNAVVKDNESGQETPQVLVVPSSTSSGLVGSVGEEKSDGITEQCKEEKVIVVVDPRRSKLRVPLSAISPTKALGIRAQNPSLCLLFQSGRCRQGVNCHQVHVDPEIVQQLRRIVDSLPCCCTFHGDCNTHCWDAKANSKRGFFIDGVWVPLSHVAYTSGLARFVTSKVQRPLSCGVLCRLHGKTGGCRYGADCWYLHVCREILEKEFACMTEANTTDSKTDSTSKLLPNAPPMFSSVMNEVQLAASNRQQQQQQQQQQKEPSSFLPAETQFSMVITSPFSTKDYKSNGSINNVFPQRDTAVASAVPCMWVHSASPPQGSALAFSAVAAGSGGGGAGMHHGCLHHKTSDDKVLPRRVPSISQNIPNDPAISVSIGPPSSPAAFAFSLGNGSANPSPVPSLPYQLVEQTPVSAMNVMPMNPSPSAAYSAMWFSHHQQQQQQAYMPEQTRNLTVPSAFVASSAGYNLRSRLEGFFQPQNNPGPSMTLLPVISYLL
ncbi:hypothetical protein MOQ_000092 [Trypanosoma cruzi marinkellei]|uniref:C3H1-type domain-containing protein n=1 Tax=Trypanosoma cruzi marinkellei TaxID=85056 RepID=K2NX85_TRYCR|nr:hypothetical protein MOQ_000092 [Trypanosoma cruzi marinkellei]